MRTLKLVNDEDEPQYVKRQMLAKLSSNALNDRKSVMCDEQLQPFLKTGYNNSLTEMRYPAIIKSMEVSIMT